MLGSSSVGFWGLGVPGFGVLCYWVYVFLILGLGACMFWDYVTSEARVLCFLSIGFRGLYVLGLSLIGFRVLGVRILGLSLRIMGLGCCRIRC